MTFRPTPVRPARWKRRAAAPPGRRALGRARRPPRRHPNFALRRRGPARTRDVAKCSASGRASARARPPCARVERRTPTAESFPASPPSSPPDWNPLVKEAEASKEAAKGVKLSLKLFNEETVTAEIVACACACRATVRLAPGDRDVLTRGVVGGTGRTRHGLPPRPPPSPLLPHAGRRRAPLRSRNVRGAAAHPLAPPSLSPCAQARLRGACTGA